MINPDNAARRTELYSLLGRLPERYAPMQVKILAVKDCGSYLQENLLLTVDSEADKPCCEPIPGYFLRPKGRGPYPAVLYNHSHGGR